MDKKDKCDTCDNDSIGFDGFGRRFCTECANKFRGERGYDKNLVEILNDIKSDLYIFNSQKEADQFASDHIKPNLMRWYKPWTWKIFRTLGKIKVFKIKTTWKSIKKECKSCDEAVQCQGGESYYWWCDAGHWHGKPLENVTDFALSSNCSDFKPRGESVQ